MSSSIQEEHDKLISEINLKTVYIDTPAPANKIIQMNNYDRVIDLFAILEARRNEETVNI